MPPGYLIFMQNFRRDAMLRVFSTIGFDLIFTLNTPVLNQDLLDFEDYRDRLRFKHNVYSQIRYRARQLPNQRPLHQTGT